jgi:hypothetical protein
MPELPETCKEKPAKISPACTANSRYHPVTMEPHAVPRASTRLIELAIYSNSPLLKAGVAAMKPTSIDLRLRIVKAVNEEGTSRREAAERLMVCPSTAISKVKDGVATAENRTATVVGRPEESSRRNGLTGPYPRPGVHLERRGEIWH